MEIVQPTDALQPGEYVSSVTNNDGTLTINPNVGAVIASLNLAHANTWTGQQTFNTSAPIIGTGDAQSLTFLDSSTKAIKTDPALWYDNTNKTVFVNWPGTAVSPNGQTFFEVFNNADITMNADNATSGVTSPTMSVSNYRLGGGYSYAQPNINNIGDTVGAFTFYGVTGTTPFTAGSNSFSVFGSINTTITGSTTGNAQGTMNFMTKANNGSTATRMALNDGNLTMSEQITWAPALGAITHILGPTDQALKISTPTSTTSAAARGITILGGTGSTTAGSTGGPISITAGPGGAVTSGTGGALSLTSGAAGGIGGAVDGGALTITSGTGSGTNGHSGLISILAGATTGTGSSGNIAISTGSVSGTFGGSIGLTAGGGITFTIPNYPSGTTDNNAGWSFVGNTASAGNGPGHGSDFAVTTGVGSIGSASTGITSGNGGAFTIIAGAAGANTNASVGVTLTGGNGGVFIFTGAAGGAVNTSIASSTHIGGNGSTFAFTGGAGGAATGALGTNNAGNGGGFTFTAGTGGAGKTLNGNGGSITFQSGAAGAGAGTAGTIGTMTWNIGGANTKMFLSSTGLFVGTTATAASAYLHLGAGTATASTAPLKFTSGTLLTAAEAGAVEFLTDKFYGTITTAAARKEFTLNDAALTSGTIPVATTNGRLTDSAFTSSNVLTKTSTVTSTGQTADIGSTNLTTTGAGLYRVAYYLVDSLADLTAGAVRLNITYTDAGAAQTAQSATVALTLLGTYTQGEFIVQLASGNIAYSTTHTGIFGTAAYNLYMTLERLN